MNVTLSVTYTGSPDTDDVRAAYQAVYIENQRRAAAIPPGTPLLTDTNANLKASYLTLLTAEAAASHVQRILLAKTQAIATRFTDAELKTIFGNLIDQLNGGATVAAVIAKTV